MRTRLSLSADARDGLRDITPVMIAAAPIGGLFGAIAASKGLSVAEVALMSTLVIAGGAQFAAIELWGYPVPVAAILFSTLLVNARHVLMGASLAPKRAPIGVAATTISRRPMRASGEGRERSRITCRLPAPAS